MSFDLSIFDDETLIMAIERKKALNIQDELFQSMVNALIIRHQAPPEIQRAPAPVAPKIHTYSGCGTKLTQVQKDLIIKMRKDGHTRKEMALKAGCSLRSVQRVLNDALLTDFSTKVSYDTETMDKIVNLSNRGKSIAEICHMLNMDNDVVRRWVNKSRARAKA